LSKNKLAVGYIRVSRLGTKFQEKESPEMQRKQIKEYCEKQGYTLKHIYEDLNYTGGNAERPDFKIMFQDIESQGEIDAVIVYNLSRFSRNLTDIRDYLNRLDQYNVNFISCTEPFFQTENSGMRSFMINIFGAIAEFQREQIREMVRKSMLSKSESGVHMGGKVLFGYKVDRDTLEYSIDEEKGKIVQYIYENYLKGKSPAKIAEEISANGMSSVDDNVKFDEATIRSILSNEKYSGQYIYGKTKNRKDGKGKDKVNKKDWIIINNNHPAIINLDLFKSVQNEINKRSKKKNEKDEDKDVTGKNLLTGKIRCGQCRSHYYVSSSTSVSEKIYFYYMCSKSSEGIKCKQKKVRKVQLEEIVFKALEQVVPIEQLYQFYREEYKGIENRIEIDFKKIKIIRKKINDLIKSRDSIWSMLEDAYTNKEKNSFMIPKYQDRLNKVDLEIDELNKKIRLQGILFEQKDIPNVEDIIIASGYEEQDVISFLKGLTFETIKKVIDIYIEEILITDKGNSNQSTLLIKFRNSVTIEHEISRRQRNLSDENEYNDDDSEYESLILITNVMTQMKEEGWEID
jgi:site-specific DNA recombinase